MGADVVGKIFDFGGKTCRVIQSGQVTEAGDADGNNRDESQPGNGREITSQGPEPAGAGAAAAASARAPASRARSILLQ
jgi:hypothetical protein